LRRALGALAVVAVLAAAGGAATALAGRVTFHEPESTDALARRLDEAVPRALAAHHVPGAAVAVVHDGRVAWARGYGVPADARRSRLEYSGGGYSVAQLWAEKASAQPFATLMRDTVLRSLGMARSSFVQADLPGDAVPHDAAAERSPRTIPAYRYAELAAAGLRSTAPDMARFAAALMPGPHGEPPRVPAAMLQAAPATGGHWSLGLELAELGDGTRVVEHEGVSRGWRSRLVAYPDRGWAIAALTNGDGGAAVADAAVAQLAR
jgi:CubicO group peptidase (beta-lactamase class C family)